MVYPVFATLLFDTTNSILPIDATPTYRGAMLGILVALTPLSQFFSAPLLGAFSDVHGRKKALLLGISAGCVGYALAVVGIVTHSIALLFLFRFLVGISEATAAVAQATLSDISDSTNKSRRFSLLNSCFGLGFTIGPLIGGKLADPSFGSWCGYDTPFYVAGAFSLLNFILVAKCFPETLQKSMKTSFNVFKGLISMAKIFMWPHMRLLYVAAFSLAFGWTVFNEFIPVLLKTQFNYGSSQIGNFYAVSGLWYALSTAFATGPLTMRFSPSKLVVASLFGSSACMLIFLGLEQPILMWVVLPPFMFLLALIYPTFSTTISNRASSESQGEALGVYHSAQAAASGLSPLIMGPIVGMYPASVAWGGAIALFVSAFAFKAGIKKPNVVATSAD
ncbi:MAG: MFS transporter [Parachlamydiales bacterium]|nr:MFS transporter [Parachlamydiales bacterium]